MAIMAAATGIATTITTTTNTVLPTVLPTALPTTLPTTLLTAPLVAPLVVLLTVLLTVLQVDLLVMDPSTPLLLLTARRRIRIPLPRLLRLASRDVDPVAIDPGTPSHLRLLRITLLLRRLLPGGQARCRSASTSSRARRSRSARLSTGLARAFR